MQEGVELFPHYHFTEWPFAVIPDEHSSTFLADRREVKQYLTDLINETKKTPSNIRIIWGWFGAGKSHVLQYLKHLFLKEGWAIPVYHQFPEGGSRLSFLDLYRDFAKNIDVALLGTLFEDVLLTISDQQMQKELAKYPMFLKAIGYLSKNISFETKELAYSWFTARKITVAEIRKIGLYKKIESTEDALEVVNAITRLVSLSKKYRRLIWIIDEANNIENLNEESKRQMLSALRTLLNTSSTHLTLVLSFGFPMKDAIKKTLALDPALVSRIGSYPIIDIPEWSSNDEILEFIRERFAHYRSNGYKGSPYFPFEESAILQVIKVIDKMKATDPAAQLIPRVILDKLNIIASRLEEDFKNKKLKVISASEVSRILNESQASLYK